MNIKRTRSSWGILGGGFQMRWKAVTFWICLFLDFLKPIKFCIIKTPFIFILSKGGPGDHLKKSKNPINQPKLPQTGPRWSGPFFQIRSLLGLLIKSKIDKKIQTKPQLFIINMNNQSIKNLLLKSNESSLNILPLGSCPTYWWTVFAPNSLRQTE